MLTIALISQKGGSGKTTLAVNLAVASQRSGYPAAVIDLDPQASAAAWGDSREAEAPVVVSAQAARLAEVLDTARTHGAGIVLIDTAPHAEAAALAAARSADFVLIPCRPSVLDLRAVAGSIDITRLAASPAAAVLSAVPPRGPLGDEAQTAIESYGLDVSPVRIGHRAAFVHAATAGLGVQEFVTLGKAAEEINRLFAWALAAARRTS